MTEVFEAGTEGYHAKRRGLCGCVPTILTHCFSSLFCLLNGYVLNQVLTLLSLIHSYVLLMNHNYALS